MYFSPQKSPFSFAFGFVCSISLLSCGDDEKLGKGAGTVSVKDPCVEELRGLCGDACEEDQNCPGGQFCEGGQCRAECTEAGAQCMGTCTAVGKCDGTLVATADLPPSGSSQDLVGDDSDGQSSGGSNCIEVVSGFEGVTPTVLIVVDRSGSMLENFDQGKNRWDTVRDTLTDTQGGLIKKLEADVRFGLSLYTSVNPGNDPTEFDVCPQLTNTPIALNGFDQINQTFGDAEPPGGGHTPTGESLEAATDTLLAVTEEGPKAIILATDGDPDNCSDGDANGEPESLDLSVNAVKRAFDANIKTYVISVGDDASQNHLKELAELGQGKPDADVFSALTTEQLEGAFQSIVGTVRSCSYDLDGDVPDFHAENGKVTLGGEALPFNDPNGWTLIGSNRVEIQGSACEQLLASDDTVNISFPCVPEIDLPK